MPKILMIIGSMRKKSINRQLAEYVESLMRDRADVLWLDYTDVPFFVQDAEFPPPSAVERVRAEVEGADAVWIFSPEYNHNIPGVLKNLLDWLSRPVGSRKGVPVLRDKPLTFSCAAGKSCARYVRTALRDFALVPGARIVHELGVGVCLGAENFAADTLPLCEETKKALAEQAEIFLSALV